MNEVDAGAAGPPAGDVAAGLLAYVRDALGAPGAAYAEPPVRFAAGVENRVYGLRLAGVPDGLAGPLVLKLFGAHVEGRRARLEAIVQDEVAAQGMPAPRVLHVCEDVSALGGAFLVMERLPGSVMLAPLASMDPPLWRVVLLARQLRFRMPDVIASLMAALHRVDAAPLVARLRSEGLLDRILGIEARLRGLEQRVAGAGLDGGFVEGARWLRERRPPEPETLHICHGDFWFGNVLESGRRVSGVLDWSADAMMIGDPMYDAGVTSVVLRCGMADVPGPLRAIARRGQAALARRFLRAYEREMPVDSERLRYYQLLRCADFLSWVAARRIDAALSARAPGENLLEVKGATEEFVRFFREQTGIALTMPPPMR